MEAERQAMLLRRRVLAEMSEEEEDEFAFSDYKLQTQQANASRQVLLGMVVLVPALAMLLVHVLSNILP